MLPLSYSVPLTFLLIVRSIPTPYRRVLSSLSSSSSSFLHSFSFPPDRYRSFHSFNCSSCTPRNSSIRRSKFLPSASCIALPVGCGEMRPRINSSFESRSAISNHSELTPFGADLFASTILIHEDVSAEGFCGSVISASSSFSLVGDSGEEIRCLSHAAMAGSHSVPETRLQFRDFFHNRSFDSAGHFPVVTGAGS